MTPEGKVKKAVDAILKKHNVWYFKPVSFGYGAHGIPDYICCAKGRLLGIECKALDGANPTRLQQATLERIAESGGSTFVATPGNLKLLESLIILLTHDPRT